MRLTLHLLANLSFFPHHVTRPFSGDLLQLNAPSRPFPLPRFLHKGHSSSCLAPMMLSLSRSTWPPHPGRPSHPPRSSPAHGQRRAHPARAGVGTPLLGGRNRRARPLPQEATAPRRRGRASPGPPRAACRPRSSPRPDPPAASSVPALATCSGH